MGLRKHCERFEYKPSSQAKSGRALRCAEFAKNQRKGPQSPVCDRRLIGGGRSKGLIRPVGCRRPRTMKMVRMYGRPR
jgi:hypothetical protein